MTFLLLKTSILVTCFFILIFGINLFIFVEFLGQMPNTIQAVAGQLSQSPLTMI